jgi:hypothetical protein
MTTDLLKEVLANPDMSEVTKRNYSARVKVLERQTQKSIEYILLHPAKYITFIREQYPNVTSNKSYFTVILGLFRYNPTFKEEHKAQHDKWSDAFKDADRKVTERYEANSPSERQTAGYVPYSEIVEARDALPQGDISRLLLGFYTHIRPLRAEFCKIAIYRGNTPASPEPNYILITGRKPNITLIIKHFKTRKSHDPIEQQLPEPLVEDITASLKEDPRDWLFTNQKGEPFTQAAFSTWTGRIFLKIFKKPLTISLIRHSFINTLDFNKLSIAEKKEIAKDMAHDIAMQDKYRLIF